MYFTYRVRGNLDLKSLKRNFPVLRGFSCSIEREREVRMKICFYMKRKRKEKKGRVHKRKWEVKWVSGFMRIEDIQIQ